MAKALKVVNTIKAWSPSRLRDYETCAAMAKYKFIDKISDQTHGNNANMERGSKIHEAAENYITSRTSTFSKDLKNPKIKALIEELRRDYKKKLVRVEMNVAVDKKWGILKDYFSPDVYARFKLDVHWLYAPGKARVIDWKTGRYKEGGDYDDALFQYAVAALTLGLAEEVTAWLAFTDSGIIVERPAGKLTKKGLPKAQKELDARAKLMLTDTRFATHPGPHCRWCAYSANNGGQCEF